MVAQKSFPMLIKQHLYKILMEIIVDVVFSEFYIKMLDKIWRCVKNLVHLEYPFNWQVRVSFFFFERRMSYLHFTDSILVLLYAKTSAQLLITIYQNCNYLILRKQFDLCKLHQCVLDTILVKANARIFSRLKQRKANYYSCNVLNEMFPTN